MNSGDLQQVRSDLSTMRHFLGFGCPMSMADVWFCTALSAAGGLYAVFRWPGSPLELPSAWAAVPIFGVIVAYLSYMMIQSHRLPPREEPRRREYKSTLLAIGCGIPAMLAYRWWSTEVGMTSMQFRGSLFVFIGIAVLVVGIAQPAPLRYPRSYFILGAVPLVLFGAAIPLAPPEYLHVLVGLMGLACVGLTTLVMYQHIRRHAAEEGAHVRD